MQTTHSTTTSSERAAASPIRRPAKPGPAALIGSRPKPASRRRARIAQATAASLMVATALGAAAAPASADSIAYIKDGNVWLTTTDGSRQYQVTTDGGYSTVSQADSGRIVALRGDRIRTFEPDGKTIHVDGSTQYDILTPHSYTMPGTTFRGPFDPTVSPDGMRIAYSWYYTQYGETPNCNPSTGCQTVYGRQGTNYISPDGKSPFDKPGFNEQTGWVGPSWTSDGGTILSDPIQVGNADVVVHTPGDAVNGLKGNVLPWFFDKSATGGLKDGEMTRDSTKLAFVTGQANQDLWLYRAKGGYPNVPENCYRLTDGKGRITSPSWSPDGTKLAFSDDNGISVLPLPSFKDDCGTPTAEHTTKLLIPGASYPDWGPADVPPARPAGAGPGAGAGAGGGKTGGAVGGVGGAGGAGKPGEPIAEAPGTAGPPTGTAITLKRTPRLKSALRSGIKLQLSGMPAGAKIKVRARLNGRVVASGSARAKQDGGAKATIRFTAAARSQLRRRTKLKLVISAERKGSRITATKLTVKR